MCLFQSSAILKLEGGEFSYQEENNNWPGEGDNKSLVLIMFPLLGYDLFEEGTRGYSSLNLIVLTKPVGVFRNSFDSLFN